MCEFQGPFLAKHILQIWGDFFRKNQKTPRFLSHIKISRATTWSRWAKFIMGHLAKKRDPRRPEKMGAIFCQIASNTLFVDHIGLCFRKAGLDNKKPQTQKGLSASSLTPCKVASCASFWFLHGAGPEKE